ncbi:MAG: hypothetical protein E7256_00350 [Lachnospiraceae bacterium]|nr:hypothetical protein [Lachnospiraceae bacterium]
MLLFIIWILCSLIFLGISASALHCRGPVHFWNVKDEIKVSDVKRYNQSAEWMWIFNAIIFSLIGILMAWGKGALVVLIIIFIVSKLNIVCMYAYEMIEAKYRVFDRKQSWWR